jgi:cytochrome c-type biogenesis protein
MDIILTSVSIGLLASVSPCMLPLYPGYLAFIGAGQDGNAGSRSRYFLGVFVLLGVLVMMLALGGLIAWISVSIGAFLSVIIPLADLIILALGILLLVGVNPFKQVRQFNLPALRHPLANAFVYGLLYGPLTLPCSGALVVGIFAYSVTAGEALSKLGVFIWFALGLGIPLLVLSVMSEASSKKLTRLLASQVRRIEVFSGILLIGLAIYDLYINRALIASIIA